MNKAFPEIRGRLGFGCMRLPMVGEEVDAGQFAQMADEFLAAGFNYFDTAHGYISGKSEPAIKAALTSRYPRDRYVLTTKLSGNFFQRAEDVRPLFEKQLKTCGVDYFDFYLMHAQSAGNYGKYKACRAYETAMELKREGRIRHLGISFHDTAEVLEQILTEYPQVEVVQLQLNYADWEDDGVQSRRCYEVCRRHGKPVIVMEPVKGGRLAELPAEAGAMLEGLDGGSGASYALRFASGLEGVAVTLSGMSDLAQMRENIATLGEFVPLSGAERHALGEVAAVLCWQKLIACTACRYCTDGCPMHIAIPEFFACLNGRRHFRDGDPAEDYAKACAGGRNPASACVQCGKCEEVCPQHLPVRELLAQAAKEFEGKEPICQ